MWKRRWEFQWPKASKRQECDEATKEKEKKMGKGILGCLSRNVLF